jgi:UrcA family protein
MRKQIYSIVVAVAFIAPSLASADVEVEKIEENKVVVSYSPAEVSTAPGRVELERQIRRAAAVVCGPQHLRAAGSFEEYVDNRACFKEAVKTAMAKV